MNRSVPETIRLLNTIILNASGDWENGIIRYVFDFLSSFTSVVFDILSTGVTTATDSFFFLVRDVECFIIK